MRQQEVATARASRQCDASSLRTKPAKEPQSRSGQWHCPKTSIAGACAGTTSMAGLSYRAQPAKVRSAQPPSPPAPATKGRLASIYWAERLRAESTRRTTRIKRILACTASRRVLRGPSRRSTRGQARARTAARGPLMPSDAGGPQSLAAKASSEALPAQGGWVPGG